MTDAAGPGPLIGSGRAADVYAIGDGQVLRRYKTAHSCAAEADLMRYLREAGRPETAPPSRNPFVIMTLVVL